MVIRPATVSDAPALARVHVDSWRAACRGLVPDSSLQGFTYQWREESFRASIATQAEETYVVLVDKEIVGFLTLGAARDADLDIDLAGEVWGIYVSPDHWHKGIGKRLAGQAEKLLTARSYATVVLWVLEGNQRARRFYEAVGFSLDGESKDLNWGRPLKAVRYAKVLQPAEESNP